MSSEYMMGFKRGQDDIISGTLDALLIIKSKGYDMDLDGMIAALKDFRDAANSEAEIKIFKPEIARD